jgi:CYTH domain-containing protein
MEIERKFLTKDASFVELAYDSCRIVQGYLCNDPIRTVRIRIKGSDGFITVKSAPNDSGWSRFEFEQKIALADAEAMLKLCLPGIIEKVRRYVKYNNHIWEVDVFSGNNEGLTVAEIELGSESEDFELPPWVGKEVTGDAKYYNSALAVHPFKDW